MTGPLHRSKGSKVERPDPDSYEMINALTMSFLQRMLRSDLLHGVWIWSKKHGDYIWKSRKEMVKLTQGQAQTRIPHGNCLLLVASPFFVLHPDGHYRARKDLW